MRRDEFEALGDRMKYFEGSDTGMKHLAELPLVVRLDGHCFHTFTRGLARPFDENFSRCMIETARYLVQETHADLAYTQSDEITLVFLPRAGKELAFDGKRQKICSIFAAKATAKFNQMVGKLLPHKADQLPEFDCRTTTYPTRAHVYENLLWRETDATRNSLTMAAGAYYSHKALEGVNSAKKHDMLMEKGVNWNDYPVHFKRGTYLKRVAVYKTLTPEELARIPKERQPEGPVLRKEVQEVNWGKPLSAFKDNFEVLFEKDTVPA